MLAELAFCVVFAAPVSFVFSSIQRSYRPRFGELGSIWGVFSPERTDGVGTGREKTHQFRTGGLELTSPRLVISVFSSRGSAECNEAGVRQATFRSLPRESDQRERAVSRRLVRARDEPLRAGGALNLLRACEGRAAKPPAGREVLRPYF